MLQTAARFVLHDAINEGSVLLAVQMLAMARNVMMQKLKNQKSKLKEE